MLKIAYPMCRNIFIDSNFGGLFFYCVYFIRKISFCYIIISAAKEVF